KQRTKKMKEKPKEFLEVKKTLNLTASSSDITDEEQAVMKSSTTTLSEKIKMCEEKMKEKFNNYEDSQSIEWKIDGVNFVHSMLVDARLICQAELNTTAEVDEKEYNEMLEKPTEFEGFDKSIDISNLKQKITTKNPFKYRKRLFIIKIVSDTRTTVAEKKKSIVIKKVRTEPKIVKKSKWYDPILKALKLKKRDPNTRVSQPKLSVPNKLQKNTR
ncbi:hypothetical protein SNEBB_009198, partial [Seison nebaliae]